MPALQHRRYITDSRQLWPVLCSGTSLQSLEQQNAGRAHAGLCHASSITYTSRHAALR